MRVVIRQIMSDRNHEQYLWEGRGQGYAAEMDPSGKLTQVICVFAPDTIHPDRGFNWWQNLSELKRNEVLRRTRAKIDAAYGYVRTSGLSLADAIEYADTAFAYQCFAICDSFERVCNIFDYWRRLGGDAYGQSDSDSFLLADAVVLTYTPDSSDIWCQTGGDE